MVVRVGDQLLHQVVAVDVALAGVAAGHPGVAGRQGREEYHRGQEPGREGWEGSGLDQELRASQWSMIAGAVGNRKDCARVVHLVEELG